MLRSLLVLVTCIAAVDAFTGGPGPSGGDGPRCPRALSQGGARTSCGHARASCTEFPCAACFACTAKNKAFLEAAGCTKTAVHAFCSESDGSTIGQQLSQPAVNVMPNGTHNVTVFRIPHVIGPFPPHSDTVMVFAEARGLDHGGPSDNDGRHALAMVRSTDKGGTWAPLRLLYTDKDTTRDYGALNLGASVYDSTRQTVHVLFNECGFDYNSSLWPKCGTYGELLTISSQDFGETWSEPRNLTDIIIRAGWSSISPGPGTGVHLDSGRLVVAGFGMLAGVAMPRPYPDKGFDPKAFAVASIISDDGGETWRIGAEVPNPSKAEVSENQVAKLPECTGCLLMNARNELSNDRYLARSSDGGETWSALTVNRDGLKGSICQGSTISIQGTLFFSHPFSPYGDQGSNTGRMDGWIKFSIDSGETWWPWRQVEPHAFAYSSLTLIDSNTTHVTLGIVYESQNTGEPVRGPADYIATSIMWTPITGRLPRSSVMPRDIIV